MHQERVRSELVSIIIPIYNVAKYLSKCLDSCIHQTYSRIEIITVNDGSTDNSLNIIEHYASSDSRISIIQKENGGLNSARQAGIEAANGKYITILDGDDYLELNAVETLLSDIIKEDADIVVGGAKVVLAENFKQIDKIEHSYQIYYGLDYTKRIISDGPNTVCMKLYKSSLIKQETQYPNIKAGQDLPVTIQWSLHTQKVVFIPDLIYNYVVAREGSTMSGDRKVYVEAAFSAFYFTFNILTAFEQSSAYTKELTRGTCAKLYKYLYHPNNQFKKNKKIVQEMGKFVLTHKKFLIGKQPVIFIRLFMANLTLAHIFVSIMQKIKPTLHKHTK